jgi:soluble lytic murein transglycosylase
LLSLGVVILVWGWGIDFLGSATRLVFHKDIINRYAAVYKFDPLLVMALVKVESRFVQSAESRRGALGLMQLMPTTAKEMILRLGEKEKTDLDLVDPEVNIRLGVYYLSLLREEFGPSPITFLAAYNAGPSHVRSWRRQGPLVVETIPYPETKTFVGNVLNTYRWLKRFQRVKNVLARNP